MQRRKKIGGLLDRRFGENDPTMTPEDKAIQRFVKEKQKGDRKGSIFDLEDDVDSPDLTHGGKSLAFGEPSTIDDFDAADLEHLEEDPANDFLQDRPTKRRKLSKAESLGEESSDGADPAHSEPSKTKKEVMEEIIAKSKLHKYERQQAKEDDEDLRLELDKGLPDLFNLMRGTPQVPPQPQAPLPPNANMNPDRMALLNGKDRLQADKEYDERLRQMAMDQRAKPSVRTLTEEEKLNHEAQRLRDLEMKRLRRMRGEPEDSESDAEVNPREIDGNDAMDPEEKDTFGLGSGLLDSNQKRSMDVEDEDDFVIEENLVDSASDAGLSDVGSDTQLSNPSHTDDDEFVQGLLSTRDAGREGLVFSKDHDGVSKPNDPIRSLAYTYRCPQTHEELLDIKNGIAVEDIPTVVQRIRALYHPKLASENKEKLGNFTTILVDHVSYMANEKKHPPFAVLEALIRHIHSLAKLFPERIARAFRTHLNVIHQQRPSSLTPGDLMILTAIGSIFPTSDHYHQVTTPAMLCMSRYLGQKIPDSLGDLTMGTYLITLCLQYQQFSKRYVPEAVNYVLTTVWALAPVKPKQFTGAIPHHTLPDMLRLQSAPGPASKDEQLTFWDVLPSANRAEDKIKVALLNTHLALIERMTVLWAEKSAFCEVFDPILTALRFLESRQCLSKVDKDTAKKVRNTSELVQNQLRKSFAARKPLRLHNHRPRAIKTSIPKFEESYNPDKHYDPDRDRAEMSKLKAEHKRERKGALRELRKDANFMARESLREKKEKDSAYEKKYKRLVAEIQGEEGREAKSYEREKRLRKSKR